ncbi:AmmeMemoRadiSam system protein A [Photobacterium phosphoreum]|uniref:AmmeMemoRadiSam system protein A n=1 Tax=Photobacterium phosphoreum TaxID=659 RepID=UPI001EFC97FA|nr:AmmeMemoRadiSam system protein A [Photobacterium phosphoreum]
MDISAVTHQTYNKGELTQLLDIARDAIRGHFSEKAISTSAPNLDHYNRKMLQSAACFVTLEVNGQLQGCIGSTIATKPLILEMHNKAIGSAYEDRRFMPLAEDQLDDLSIEVEVLSPLVIQPFSTEAELFEYLSHHKQGVQLTDRHVQTVVLPSAWRRGLSTLQFIQLLKQKAGWSANYWSDTMVIKTFTTCALKENFNTIRGKYF